MTELITFPHLGQGLRSSSEGGTFVVAAWRATGGFARCTVDVHPELTHGDCLVTGGAARRAVFGDRAPSREPFPHDPTPDEVAAWECRQREAERSDPLWAAVHLGSTGTPLYDEALDRYWFATRRDLTDAGRVVVNTLDAVYGVEGVLLTWLDT